jgi:trafficking protein particle complex subunit 11
LSPGSHIYPDGLIDAQWIQKHQELVPSIYLCFYALTTDPTTTTLQDNRLKNDIADIRTALAKSGYKTRLAVALLSDDDSTPATLSTGLQERLENIRKGAGLDPKSLFYIPPQESPADLKGVADSILAALYASAVEYYRDLGRHAKKKRGRGVAPQPTVPPTTGTSRTLSLPDWNFRYDFKSAVFGEFRQEYDAAIRSYEQSYEILLGQDVLDIIPSWSPRWNEARLLSDIIAIRCLRIHFWMSQPTIAVRKWQMHRDRIGQFVDRRGHGTQNYGWEAWEARWALVMADLMEKVEVKGLEPTSAHIFLPPERTVAGERLQPWELLHHKGYWYRNAARHLAIRRTLAQSIPDEDRIRPDKSAAAGHSYNYDTYLCPEPYQEYPLEGEGVNHSRLIIDCLITAQSQFQSRRQTRAAAEMSLECAKEMANLGSWQEVLAVLRPLWENLSFRSEGWNDISEDMCWLMRRAAVEEGRGDLIVAVDWQLMKRSASLVCT